ncbi:MAG: 3-deoxy-7-phosphoheptulonate synthase [Sphingomonadales bacterium]|jgi:chorismate mutase|nr:3-deoxy-7-phosphoheptulonate synthase [Sphingomonadales bacterium]
MARFAGDADHCTPDDVYEWLVEAHAGLDDEASQRLNFRLILILVEQIGAPQAIRDAIAASSAALADPDLSAMRREIDALDDRILELLERRILRSQATAAAKAPSEASLHIRPRREADILERLTRRARILAPSVVEIVWRELMGQGRQAQSPLGLLLCASRNPELFELQVRSHYGSATPVAWDPDPVSALERAKTEPVVAILQDRPAIAGSGPGQFDTIRDRAGGIVGFAFGRVAPEDDPAGGGET